MSHGNTCLPVVPQQPWMVEGRSAVCQSKDSCDVQFVEVGMLCAGM